MTAYYNEHDPFAAAWLRELIKAGHIAPGEVDERSIEDVRPSDLREYTQCHFFAGIGVWSYALLRAGWPAERPVWTGSCPCQPFSTAGKRKGTADERHLWPSLFHLIQQAAPVTFFGEQVGSKDGLAWLDTVSADLEGAGYTVGAVDTCAAGFGAPHIRQRLYFVANSSNFRREQRGNTASASVQGQCTIGSGQHAEPGHERQLPGRSEGLCRIGDGLDNSTSQGLQERTGQEDYREEARSESKRSGHTRGFWERADWIGCLDGRYRPIEPGVKPLVDGSPNRVGRLRGYGNALVAPVAQGFIEAFLEVERERGDQ